MTDDPKIPTIDHDQRLRLIQLLGKLLAISWLRERGNLASDPCSRGQESEGSLSKTERQET